MVNKIERIARRPIYPTPAGLVVSIDAQSKPNIISLGEIFNLSIREPVWVGIAIRKDGTFATRADKPGIWRIDGEIKQINDAYPAFYEPPLAFRADRRRRPLSREGLDSALRQRRQRRIQRFTFKY